MTDEASTPVLTGRQRTSDKIRAALLAGCTPEAADEALLTELAASAAGLAFELERSSLALAELLPQTLSDSRLAVSMAKTLGELVALGNALTRRVEGSLSCAAALRAQRRLVRAAAK